MENEFFRMTGIVKRYQMGDEVQTVLRGVNLEVREGDFLSVLGPSGSGKSTLMNIIGCLDTPSEGKYVLRGREIARQTPKQLAAIRNREIGFVFQSFQLLPRLSALRNVELPLIYAGMNERDRLARAEEMLARVGLSDKLGNRPNQLSGGQQQRVAIARAMATSPSILLADEPTGALDQATGKQVMSLFQDINREGHTIIMITHDLHIAQYGHRIVHILDGELREGDATDA